MSPCLPLLTQRLCPTQWLCPDGPLPALRRIRGQRRGHKIHREEQCITTLCAVGGEAALGWHTIALTRTKEGSVVSEASGDTWLVCVVLQQRTRMWCTWCTACAVVWRRSGAGFRCTDRALGDQCVSTPSKTVQYSWSNSPKTVMCNPGQLSCRHLQAYSHVCHLLSADHAVFHSW